MMKHLKALPAIVALALCAPALRAELLNKVSADEQKELAAGQVVVESTKVQGAPWPQLSLYQVVDAPPKVMADLLNDYSSAPSYTPNMISAKLIGTNGDGSKDIEYTAKMPVFGTMTYSVRNTYVRKGKDFTVSWTLLKSPFAKKSDGSIKIEPYGNNQTIMCYTNLVVPITSMIPGIQGQALSEAKSTVAAIKGEAEKRAKN
jgi:hypothetical protein